ncbi:glyoxalase [Burkholderia sp. BCC0419]|uniref:glyoxalase n=1 Tax=Burkholderia sp. BCC0419 TaxID=486878 RepID=UPI00158DE0B2|nr:glyoxalase [Burkholderia sp. BCC0419]
MYVEDTNSTCRRALAAHAIPLEAPADRPDGDGRAMVKDACGNVWRIATHRRDLSAGAIRSRLGDGE